MHVHNTKRLLYSYFAPAEKLVFRPNNICFNYYHCAVVVVFGTAEKKRNKSLHIAHCPEKKYEWMNGKKTTQMKETKRIELKI